MRGHMFGWGLWKDNLGRILGQGPLGTLASRHSGSRGCRKHQCISIPIAYRIASHRSRVSYSVGARGNEWLPRS